MFEAVYFKNTSLSIYQAAWKIIFGHLQLLFGQFLSTLISLSILHHTFERYHTPNSNIAYNHGQNILGILEFGKKIGKKLKFPNVLSMIV